MYKERIGLYQSENPNKQLPSFKTLSKSECENLSKDLSYKYFQEIKTGLELITSLYDVCKRVKIITENEEPFILSNFLKDHGIEKTGKCYIDWYRFTRIDQFQIADVDWFFDYIYYPVADDIAIFSENLEWLLLIDHDENISMCKP
jgi:hypothetical protein